MRLRAGHFGQGPCQIRGLNQFSVTKHRGLDEGVVELSDVPRPGVPLQKSNCTLRNLFVLVPWFLLISEFLVDPFEEGFRQEGDVLLSFAERGEA